MKKPILFWSLFLLSILIIMLFNLQINHVAVYQLEDFDVKKDGFQFANYTNSIPNNSTQNLEEAANLTAAEMQRLFKSENICSNAEEVKKGNECILIPQAKEWMERVNNGMSEGHCEGMAVLSLALYEGRLKGKACQDDKNCVEASKLWQGAKTAYDLPFNSPIQREIAYWYATQFTFPTRVIEDEPNTYEDLVTQLKKTMRRPQSSPHKESKQSEKLYTMAVYWKEGSHLITPYKIEEKGILPGFKKYVIWVYDNAQPSEEIKLKIDHPREKTQPIIFSTRGKTSKDRGSVIANGAEITSMRLIKNIYRKEEQSTLFTLTNNQIWTQGGANLKILSLTDQEFKKVNQLESPDPSNNITTYHCPGKESCYVQQDFSEGKQDDVSSVYHIPVGVPFKLKVSTSSEKNKDKPKAIKMIGPYYYFEVENMKINYEKEKNILVEFIPEKNTLTFENNTGRKQDTLTISGGFPIDQGSDYELVQVKKVSVESGNKLEITRSWQKMPDWYKQFVSLKVSKAKNNKETVTLKQFTIKRRKGDGLDTFSVVGSNQASAPEISLGKDEQLSFSFGLMPSDLVPPFGLMPSNVVCRFPVQRRDKDGKIVDSLLLTNKDCKDLPKYSLFDEAEKVAKPVMSVADSTQESPGKLNQFIRHWQQAIGLMQLVPQTDSDYKAAQKNIRDYKEYLRSDVERLWKKVLPPEKKSDFFWGTASYWDTVTRYWYWETKDKSGSNTVAKERYQETLNFALKQLTQLSKQMPESSQSEEARQDLEQAKIKIKEYETAINNFKQAENN